MQRLRNTRELVMRIEIGAATVKNKMEFPWRSTNRNTTWSSNPLLGTYLPPKKENTNLKRHMYPNVYCSIIYNSQDMKVTHVHQQMYNTHTHTHTHTHRAILLSHKKEWNLTICNNVDYLEGIKPSEISQSKIDKYCMISLICRIKKAEQMNKQPKSRTRPISTENSVLPEGKWVGDRQKWVKGSGRFSIPVIVSHRDKSTA